MKLLSKSTVAVLIIMLAASSLLVIKPAFAQSILSPVPPQFTVRYADYSYDVPPTYGIDQYTGKNVTTSEGYHVDNKTVVFTVKNQPFTPYTDSSGNLIGLYYNFRGKGSYGTEWNMYPFSNQPSDLYPSTSAQSVWRYDDNYSPKYPASNTNYTEIAIPLRFFSLQSAPLNSKLDFQVQSMTGHIDPITTGPISGEGYYSFTGQFSGWSTTQTVTVEDTPSISPNTTGTIPPTPAIPELSLLATLPLILGIPLIILKSRQRKKA
jgi:hypothetical protein